MLTSSSLFQTTGRSTADAVLIELLIKHNVLMEEQLRDLQGQVRQFVEQMNAATMKLDASVTEEGLTANAMYESIYEESQKESQVLNERAAARVDDLIAQALSSAGADANISQDLLNSINTNSDEKEQIAKEQIEAHDQVWSKISKKLESVTRLEERLRPHVFKIIECLNFEDIQSQRLQHVLQSSQQLNEGIKRYLQAGHTLSESELKLFANNFLIQVRKSYTTEEERHIFDNIFVRKT